MAAPAYKINDRRGKNTGSYFGGGNNQLYKAATQSQDRKAIPNLSFDAFRNVSRMGHNQLRNVGRFLFGNFAPIHGALLEQAELSVGHFIPQYTGEDQEWGKLAEKWLMDWNRIMDVRGWPYDCGSYLRNLIVGVRRDGDHFTLLTEGADGYPLVQVIGSHRIHSDCEEVKGGELDGLTIYNGVIVDDYGRTIGYRIYNDNPGYNSTDYRDISAADGFLLGFPEYCDQYRFDSSLASSAADWQDVYERRGFEMLAQKLGSSIALIETNERGEPAPGIGAISRPSATDDTAGTATGLITETYDGGVIRYMKANSGEKLDTLRMDRPTANAQEFEAQIIRGAFKGMEWDVDFSLDPSKVGGASMRVVVEKINRTIEKNQLLAEKAMRRVHGYAISKAIKLGLIPENEEWFKWEYQGPARVTADAKYDDDIARERLKMGGMTYRDWYAMRGLWWEDEVRQRISEQKFIEVESEKAGVDVNKVQMLTPNGNSNVAPQVDNPPMEE